MPASRTACSARARSSAWRARRSRSSSSPTPLTTVISSFRPMSASCRLPGFWARPCSASTRNARSARCSFDARRRHPSGDCPRSQFGGPMAVIQLRGTRREKLGKGGARKARAAGLIPGVVYGHGEPPVPVAIETREFQTALRHHKGGNAIVNLAVSGGEFTALIRDVQYDPLSREIMHLDFHHISLTETVEVRVTVHLNGLPLG